LAWNVPDSAFALNGYSDVVREVLAHIFNNTLNDVDCKEWLEVNGIKYLFRDGQPWTRVGAHDFVNDAWNYVGFK
jgi:hypothetical protein